MSQDPKTVTLTGKPDRRAEFERKTVACKVIHETEKAWLLEVYINNPEIKSGDIQDSDRLWFPKSQVKVNYLDDTVTLPMWLFNQKNMLDTGDTFE